MLLFLQAWVAALIPTKCGKGRATHACCLRLGPGFGAAWRPSPDCTACRSCVHRTTVWPAWKACTCSAGWYPWTSRTTHWRDCQAWQVRRAGLHAVAAPGHGWVNACQDATCQSHPSESLSQFGVALADALQGCLHCAAWTCLPTASPRLPWLPPACTSVPVASSHAYAWPTTASSPSLAAGWGPYPACCALISAAAGCAASRGWRRRCLCCRWACLFVSLGGRTGALHRGGWCLGQRKTAPVTRLAPRLPLQELAASSNQLTCLPPSLSLPLLRELWLGGNQLAGVPAWPWLPSLQGLHLQDNRLTHLAPLRVSSTAVHRKGGVWQKRRRLAPCHALPECCASPASPCRTFCACKPWTCLSTSCRAWVMCWPVWSLCAARCGSCS